VAVIPLAPWQNDWLYALVLREAERDWEWCGQVSDGDVWRYVLVEEWSSANHSKCDGRVVRAWVRDVEGLREIGLDDHKRHRRRIRGRIYPFVIMEFHIYPDRARVALGHRQANTAGAGCRFLVQGEGTEAELEYDPAGGGWRS